MASIEAIRAECERDELRDVQELLGEGSRVLVMSRSGRFVGVNDKLKQQLADAINKRIEQINQQIGDYEEV